jgi:hypothetical protein
MGVKYGVAHGGGIGSSGIRQLRKALLNERIQQILDPAGSISSPSLHTRTGLLTVTSPSQDVPDEGPLATATSTVVAWLKEASGDAVQIAPPGTADAGLSVWPLELKSERELRTHHVLEPLRLRVRHLVTGNAAMLGKALVAATQAGEPAVDVTPLSPETWLALGCPPRTALLFDMPVIITRPMPEVPIVTEELRLTVTPKTASQGGARR